MLDNEPTGVSSTDTTSGEQTAAPTSRRRTTRRAPKAAPIAGDATTDTGSAETPPSADAAPSAADGAAAAPAPAKRARKAAKKAVPATPEPTVPAAAADLTAAAVDAVVGVEAAPVEAAAPAKKAARKAATPRKRAAKKAEPAQPGPAVETGDAGAATPGTEIAPTVDTAAAASDVSGSAAPAKRTRRSRAAKAAPATVDTGAEPTPHTAEEGDTAAARPAEAVAAPPAPPVALFVAPPTSPILSEAAAAPAPRKRARRAAGPPAPVEAPAEDEVAPDETAAEGAGVSADPTAATEVAAEGDDTDDTDDTEGGERRRRRRGRRGRGRGKGGDDHDEATADEADTESGKTPGEESSAEAESDEDTEEGGSRRRTRRRRRRGSGGGDGEESDEAQVTVTKVREPRSAADEVQGVKGSTRLEAKRQRRRDGRDQGRRRPPVLSEAEFLARREAVERVMVVRQVGERTQIAVLEDDVLVEHYVTKASNASYAGNVYLGKVQNVLPSMEAAFIDIGKGRNAVLYAGEVNWDAAGMDGKPRKIEQALRSGDPVLVQVTKDPIGHKGARLTSQISLPGRFLVYVPEGQMTGISRKLPDTERKRLKDILKRIVPENAGVIIRTAAEGASEEELTRDVARLEAQWQSIKAKAAKGQAPSLLNAEPDLVVRVIRDIFNEDFSRLVVSGDEAWETVREYVEHVSPDLVERLSRHTAEEDVFSALRIDEQLTKALDRKVWLPSGGSLVIDRTEAMTVVDVNTGKFTGQGGNLEETVTRNNLEAAEEIVRQLRLRDIGGMIVVDFIDMVLESNRDLVLRRLTECLGRDRTKHQVAEVTSLGLVQMTRKRVGQGLLEVFSETCEHCKGRGLLVHHDPVDRSRSSQPQSKLQPPKPAPPALPPPAPEVAVATGLPETAVAADADVPADGASADAEAAPGAEPRSRRRRGRGRDSAASAEPAEPRRDEAAASEATAEAPGTQAPAVVTGSAPQAGAESPAEAAGDEVDTAAPADTAVPVEAAVPADTGTTERSEDLGTEPWPAVPAPDPAQAGAAATVDAVTSGDGAANGHSGTAGGAAPRRRRRAASRPAGPPVPTV